MVVAQVFSGIVFLLSAYVYKAESIWRSNKYWKSKRGEKLVVDPWSLK
jgi:hypothetical protein